MTLKVVHVACTPLAGAPIRIVQALNRHTKVKARFIDLDPTVYGQRTFPEDLLWDKDRSECMEVIAAADILHFHHFFDIGSARNPFAFAFRAHAKKGCRFIRHMHSAPYDRPDLTAAVDDSLPQLVIPHYPERYFPHARVVPNIVEWDGPVGPRGGDTLRLFFSPSRPTEKAWESRWNTKGAPETIRLLERVSADTGVGLSVVQGEPFEVCQRKRAASDIVVDDLVTGSYHLAALEAVAMGKATVCYLDSRAQMVLQGLTQAPWLPFVNVRLEEAGPVLTQLCRLPQVVEGLGEMGKAWFDTYYAAARMVGHYVEAYEDLMVSEARFMAKTQSLRSELGTAAGVWVFRDVGDLAWQQRRRLAEPLNQRLARVAGSGMGRVITLAKTMVKKLVKGRKAA